MGKKLIKDSPLKKGGIVGGFISTVDTESRKDVNTETRKGNTSPTDAKPEPKAVNTENRRTVKLTLIIPEEYDLLLEDIKRKRRREGRRTSKKELVIEAIKLLAEKERIP